MGRIFFAPTLGLIPHPNFSFSFANKNAHFNFESKSNFFPFGARLFEHGKG